MKMKLKRPFEANTMFRSDNINIEKLTAIFEALKEYAKDNDIEIIVDDYHSSLGFSGMLDDVCIDEPVVIGWVFGFGNGVRDNDDSDAQFSKRVIYALPNFPFELEPEDYGVQFWSRVNDWFENVDE